MTDTNPWPFTLDGIEDPRPGFDRLRAQDPLQYLAGPATWVATGHRPVTALLRDARCVTPPVPTADAIGGGDEHAGEPVRCTLMRMAVLSDPPEHRARRAPVQRGFAAEVVEPARGRIRAHAADLLGAATPPVDVVEHLAVPVFDRVLDEQLRLPSGAGRNIRRAWKKVSATLDQPDAVATALTAGYVHALHDSLTAHLAAMRNDPRTGPEATSIDVMLAVAAAEPDVTDDDLVANLILSLTSGHRSGAQALALAIHTLATHPDEYQRLRAAPDGVAGAVEELLRWDGSVQFTNRLVTEDLTIDGHDIPAGDVVMLVLGAANHDPSMFPEDALDLSASRRPHLGFGRGAHYCAGAPLARIALAEVLGALRDRAEHLSLAATPTFTTARRGLESLLVTW